MRDELKEEFEGHAEWRRAKAEEYPSDTRNLEAAAIFEKLAASAIAIPHDLIEAYATLWDESSRDPLLLSELWSEHLRSVGFHSFPDNATECVADFIEAAKREQERFEAA